jgi:hypothetical protein
LNLVNEDSFVFHLSDGFRIQALHQGLIVSGTVSIFNLGAGRELLHLCSLGISKLQLLGITGIAVFFQENILVGGRKLILLGMRSQNVLADGDLRAFTLRALRGLDCLLADIVLLEKSCDRLVDKDECYCNTML